MANSNVLTIREVARELEVDERTVRRWIKSGELRSIGFDIKKRYLVSRTDLDAFIQQRTGRSNQE
ncbi:MAG TPA: helix-turn-helix domain-containing protein [Ktedonobacteraceae bacterium]|nr:helix-turn-helix domain-containing protein [Ktedonobacteraceae bacterium]